MLDKFKVGDYVTCVRQGVFQVKEVQQRWYNDNKKEVDGRVPNFLNGSSRGNKRQYTDLLSLELVYLKGWESNKTWVSMDASHCEFAEVEVKAQIQQLQKLLEKIT